MPFEPLYMYSCLWACTWLRACIYTCTVSQYLRYVGSLGLPPRISWAADIFCALLILLWIWKKSLNSLLENTKTILQRLLIIVHEPVCKQPSVILRMHFRFANVILHAIISTSKKRILPGSLPCGWFLQVAICAIISTSCFLVLVEDGYHQHWVGWGEPLHMLVWPSIHESVHTMN